MKSRPYPLPGGYTVTFERTALGMNCGKRLLPYYRAARNEWLLSLGLTVAVIEL